MAINLSNLKPASGATKKSRQVGRGGKRGSYSGRGMKGQRARSGGKGGLKALGLKQTLQRIPKSRGFKSFKPKMATVNLADLDKIFSAGEIIDAKKLLKAGLINSAKNGVKILGDGKLAKEFQVIADKFSSSAQEAITKAGGKAELKK
jgi:large subunit ribosomal protein L15